MQEKNICLDDSKQNLVENDIYDYSKFIDRDGYILDTELKNKFAPIAKKLNLTQDSVDMLLEIALEMSEKQKAVYEKDAKTRHEETITKYGQLFKDDSDIPNINSEQLKEYMETANEAYCELCSPKLKEIFKQSGLVYHPELIKLFFKIGEISKEDGINYCGKPAFDSLSPAQILYGNA